MLRRPVEAGIYLVVTGPAAMGAVLPVEAWYVAAVLMIPCGLGLQDAVADAMTVEAVPVVDAAGVPLDEAISCALHTTLQTLGGIALIGAAR